MAADSEQILKARGEEEKDIRRQHIIDSAERVMMEGGLSKFSIAAVAREAKLAKGTLYLYFKNKEQMIAQLTLKSREALLQSFRASVECTDDPLQQIRNIIVASFKFYEDYERYYELISFYEANSGLKEPPVLEEASAKITALVVDTIERAIEAGAVRPSVNPNHLSYIMWGTSMGIVQLINVKREALRKNLSASVEDFYESYIELMINGIRA
ncbi:MAG: TetR/AcrR family transcriptional regulator [Bacteroidota bacterium]